MANNKPKDIILTCAKCGSRFYFTVGEQQFYKSKGLNIPKYCKNCRANKREEIVRKQERREAWVPKACSTCYFCCSREEWVIGKGYDDVNK